jgi:4-hydroxybenzoate polyprenyltransferase
MYIVLSLIAVHKITKFHLDLKSFFAILIANTLGVFGIYLINKISDRVEDISNGHAFNFSKNSAIIRGGVFLFCISGILYLIPQKILLIPGGVLLLTLGVLYSFPPNKRLKNIFIVKNSIPAFCWFLSLSLLIFGSVRVAESEFLSLILIMKLLLPILVLEFIFEIIWDMPDRKGDSVAGVKTIPLLIGFLKTKILLIILSVIAFFMLTSLHNKIACILFIIFLIHVKDNTPKKTYHHFLSLLTLLVGSVYFGPLLF